MIFYFDTSALVKYYAIEPGSTWIKTLINQKNVQTNTFSHNIFIAEITRVEIASALAIIQRLGRISIIDRDDAYYRFMSDLVHRFEIVPFNLGDFQMAATLTHSYPLKAYDAVQLAVALRPNLYPQISAFSTQPDWSPPLY